MKTIQLKVSEKAYDKFLSLLSKFNKEEIQILEVNEDFIATNNYLQNELYGIAKTTTSIVSEEILENPLNKIVMTENEKDWWNEMTKQEQEEIKKGLHHADNGNVISNEKV